MFGGVDCKYFIYTKLEDMSNDLQQRIQSQINYLESVGPPRYMISLYENAYILAMRHGHHTAYILDRVVQTKEKAMEEAQVLQEIFGAEIITQ